MLLRNFSLRALLPLLAVFALGLSAPLMAQETALHGAASAPQGAASSVKMKTGSRSTRSRFPFIAQSRFDEDEDGNPRLPANLLVPGNRQPTDVQVGVHPRAKNRAADLSGSNLFTQFKAFDGPNPYIPPDPSMATGPNDLLVATNDGWSIFDRSGNQLFTTNYSSWFGDTNTNDQYGDPHVIYDPWHSRFVFVVLMKNPVTLAADWVVDASDTSSAQGGHHYYYLNARLNGGTDVNNWMDYPYLGYSATAIYLTGTMIDWSSGNWQYAKIRILNPSQLYSNGSSGVGWWDFWNVQNNGNLDFDISPAQQLTSEGVEYLVNSQNGGSNYLTVRRITNELNWSSGPTLTAETVNVASYSSPPAAGQPDGTTALENSDCRLSQSTMQFGELSAVGPTGYNFGDGTRSALKIYRLLVNSGTTTVDRDRVYGFTDLDAFYPAIQGTVDDDQFLTFDYSGTGSGNYASVAVAGWSNSESGVDQAIQTAGGQGDYFQDFGKGRNRWGDYSTVSLDPNDYRTVWATSEYAATGTSATNGLWSTWVSEFNTKPNGVVAVNSAVGSIGQTIALSANLTNSQTSAAISGEYLYFYVDGNYVGAAATDGSGNGSVSYTVPSTSPGYHTITVNFPGDSTYNAGSASNSLIVYANTDLAVPTVTGLPGQTVTLSATLTQDDTGADLSGQTIYFYVDSSYISSAVTNSSGVASLAYAIPTNTAGGNHTLEAYFPGAGYYNGRDTFGTLTVTVNTVTTVGNRIAAPNTTTALKSYLKTAGGTALSGETLTYKVNGVAAGSAVTDSTGLATLNYNVPASAVNGNESVVVSFAGDTGDNPSSGTGTLTISGAAQSTAVTVAAVSGAQGQTVNLSATLKAGSTLLSGKTLTFKVDSTTVGTAVTNGSGVATEAFAIPTAETAGGHTITVSFAGDSSDAASSGTGTLTVTAANKLNTVVTVGARTAAHGTTAALKSYLKTSGGAVLAGKTLTYKVNGVAAGSAVTDSTGLATLNYAVPASAPAGNEPVVVSFAGDSGDNPSSGTGTLTVTAPVLSTAVTVAAVSGAQGQTVNLSATLKAGSTLLSGKTLTFKVDSTTVGTAVTNSSGVATEAFAIPTAETAGGHTITVSFAGDSGDSASSGTGTLTVAAAKLNTAVTVGNRIAAPSTTTALKSYLKTSGGAVLAGKTLTYKVNGVAAGSAVTDSTGLATLNYNVPASAVDGNEPIVVSFAGDSGDNPSSGTGTLTISK